MKNTKLILTFLLFTFLSTNLLAQVTLEWVSLYNGTGNYEDNARSIAIDGSGNVYVTGYSMGSGTDYDYATVKYNSAGVQQWASRYNGPGNDWDGASSVAVDGSGNVYVTGKSMGSGTHYDIATIKYNSSGVQQWVQRYNGITNSWDEGKELVLDDSGNVYVAGFSTESGPGADYTTIKYNPNGVQQWIQRYNGPGNHGDGGYSIVLDDFGNVYVTGDCAGIGPEDDYGTLKYSQIPNPIPAAPILITPPNNATGQALNILFVWNSVEYANKYRFQLSTDISFTNIVLDDSTLTDTMKVVTNLSPITDYYWRVNAKNMSGTGPWSTIFHFTTGTTNITGMNEIPKEFMLYNNFPNPFNPTTKIKFDIPKPIFVKIIIYNSIGKEINILVNEKLNAGRYEVSWPAPTGDGSNYPSGVYFYKMITDEYVSVKKMLLIK